MQAESDALKVAYADQVQIAGSHALPKIALAGMHKGVSITLWSFVCVYRLFSFSPPYARRPYLLLASEQIRQGQRERERERERERGRGWGER